MIYEAAAWKDTHHVWERLRMGKTESRNQARPASPNTMNIPKELYISCFPTGSNYICNPPVEDTDIDTMYLVHNVEETDKN